MIRVIIADDESSIRNGLSSTVPWKQLHMSVMGIARDGAEAWELIRTYKPSIVVTDIRMPNMTGLELIQKCREQNIPAQFIILSGYDDFSYAQTAIRYGARSYVLKPLKTEELMAELESLKKELETQNTLDTRLNPAAYEALKISSKKLFLNRLIQNEFRHSTDIHQKLEELHINLSDTPYLVMVFSIHQSLTMELSVIQEQISDIFSKFGEEPLQAAVWECTSAQIVAILHLTENTALNIPALAQSCADRFKHLDRCRVIIGIGCAEGELIHAGRSYATALTALSYELYESGQDIYDESLICTSAPPLSAGQIDIRDLIQAIRTYNREKIAHYCRNYFDSLMYVPMPPPSFIRGMSIYLITDVQNTLRRQIQSDRNLFPEMPYVTVNKLSSLRQIKEWTTSLFYQYGACITQHLLNYRDTIILDAKLFIQNNIGRKIQAEDVAAHVNLSTSYFTIYFKARTKINFRDYVLDLKMEQAKLLLSAGTANISEVSYAVGYDDYRSFYRAFKNHTGLTPSEYQSVH